MLQDDSIKSRRSFDARKNPPNASSSNPSHLEEAPNPVIRRPLDISSGRGAPLGSRSVPTTSNPTPRPPEQPLRITWQPIGDARSPVRPRRVDATGVAAKPTGPLLRRTGAPRAPRAQNPRQIIQYAKARQHPRRRRAREEDTTSEDEPSGKEWHIKKPEPEPQPVPYNPEALTEDELRPDWPASAVDARGSMESLQQRIEFLARRFPHGFYTTHELAERFHRGEIVHFQSAAERDETTKIASDMAKERAEKLSARRGGRDTFEPEDMSFADVTAAERKKLGAEMVKGEYPLPQKHNIPFLNQVQTSLWNNETYQARDAMRFMEKVQSLLPANARAQAQGQDRNPR